MKHLKKNLYMLPILLITIMAVTTGFILPGYLLNKDAEAQMSVVTFAPEEFYLSSNTVMARNSSEKLSSLDKINLISGKWASSYVECATSEAFLTEVEAVNLAINQINQYHDAGVYPESLYSNYSNWYSWTSKVYKYTDSSFSTYTAYLWVITFSKYDKSTEHIVVMTEDGVILNAETNNGVSVPHTINSAYTTSSIKSIIGSNNVAFEELLYVPVNYNISSVCPDISLDNAEMKSVYKLTISESFGAPQDYFVYQYKTGTRQGIGLIPVM